MIVNSDEALKKVESQELHPYFKSVIRDLRKYGFIK